MFDYIGSFYNRIRRHSDLELLSPLAFEQLRTGMCVSESKSSPLINKEPPMTIELDPRIPEADTCVLPRILARYAELYPARIFATFEDGEAWSYSRTRDESSQTACALLRLNVQVGDRVLIWLPNGKTALRSWFGVNHIGAVSVPINTAYKGGLLQHVIDNSDAHVMLCHGDLIERLLELKSHGSLQTIVTSSEKIIELNSAFGSLGISLVPFEALDAQTENFSLPDLQPWDFQSICYTSGTTGISKGVMSSYLHLFTMGWNCTKGLTADDRYLINLPLFHVGGTLFVTGALARGASIAVISQFSTGTFFEVCRRLGATRCLLLGAMAGFLMRATPHDQDRNHPLKQVMVIPLSEDARVMSKRFGFDVVTLFNMSEIAAPIVSDINPTAPGSCGRLREGVEARLVDRNDCEVLVNNIGELVLRSDCPWTMSHGYFKMPDATASAWRNGWFHTGDLFRRDQAGNYFFMDRAKDAIRRRGENISSFEVEVELLAHPDVLEAAAVGVASDHGEEDVLVVVVPKLLASIDPAELIGYLAGRMAHFMVPRFVRVVAALPKTPTSKIEKHVLRAEGVTPDTWDRESVGLRISSVRLE